MKRIQYFLLAFSLILLISCQETNLVNLGGILVTLEVKGEHNPAALTKSKEILKERIASISPFPEDISISDEKNLIRFKIPGMYDTLAVRQLIERNRMMRLAHAIPTSNFTSVREYLSDYITIAPKKKDYKPESMIGLVLKSNKEKLEEILNSQDFKEAFPQVAHYYFGVKSMESKLALFMEAKGSTIINENMYARVEKFEGDDPEVGIMSLLLKDDVSSSLGPLTGNDSTYLLHIFHNEVYISKIIKPYIEGPAFSMSGAFSPRDVEVLTALWKSDPLEVKLKIRNIELIEK